MDVNRVRVSLSRRDAAELAASLVRGVADRDGLERVSLLVTTTDDGVSMFAEVEVNGHGVGVLVAGRDRVARS